MGQLLKSDSQTVIRYGIAHATTGSVADWMVGWSLGTRVP